MPAPFDTAPSPYRSPAKWARLAFTVAFLYGIWLLLSGRLYPQYLLIGAGGALLIALTVFPWKATHPFPVLKFLLFAPWHLWQVLVSNLRVAGVALSRSAKIQPRFVRVNPGTGDARALATLGCAVTLTPGTLTVEIEPGAMLVHSLDAASSREIEEGVMADHVKKVFS